MHDVFRFGRVVNYLHRIAPASGPALRAVILEEEDVQGIKYADGVIDVAGALALIARVGPKLTLADRGYALHAVQQMDNPADSKRALLLNAILESDGDATLNLLDLIANSASPESLGPLLMERLVKVIQQREEWVGEHIDSKLARDLVLQDLSDAKQRLQQAIDLDRKRYRSWSSYSEARRLNPEQRLARFYDHTIQPRRGWLRDLGCIEQRSGRTYEATQRGLQLLASLKESSCYSDSLFVLPFSAEVMELLGIARTKASDDLLWRATVCLFTEDPSQPCFSARDSFQLIKSIYPHAKLHVFNEATVESIYLVLAARLAVGGVHLSRQAFDQQLNSVCSEFSESIYRLRQRQGGSGYIAMRGTLG